jgi:4-hydroxy-tetrahydrodipicolinate synthase
MAHAIQGVYSAVATPVGADGSVRLELFESHCRALLDEGCHGLAIWGTTGEANSFAASERQAALEAALGFGIRGDQLLPGTSSCNVPETVALTRHAVAHGAAACLMLPPFYYKGVGDEGLFRFYASVIEGVADERLKVILYNIPQVSGVPLTHDLIERLIEAFPGAVVGIKDSSGSMENMTGMIDRFPGFSVLAGADSMLLPLLKAGGAGCITATSNLRADALRVVWDHWRDPTRSDDVAAAHDQVVAWRDLANSNVQLPTIKAMIAKVRDEDDWCDLRAPLVALCAEDRKQVWAEMKLLENPGKPAD